MLISLQSVISVSAVESILTGTAGNGDDVMTGGGGWDVLFGGEGRDTFVYRSGDATNDSDLSNGRQAERIMDFKLMEDHIDVSAIDANVNLRGDQAFVFVATFTGAAGEIQARLYNEDSTDPYWMVWGETNAIAGTDLWIETHIDPISQPANLGAIASDFIL